nr:hypothetical protein [Chitinophagaceae bacterium]
YFNNEKLDGSPVYSTTIPEVNFYFTEGQPPAAGLPANHYSTRYSTQIKATRDETLIWQLEGDE